MITTMMLEGLELLSQDQVAGLSDMVQGAINVLVKHKGDPRRDDAPTLEDHLIHAVEHIATVELRCIDDNDRSCRAIDDDGLPHVDHATARIALYYARKLVLKEQDASGY